MNIDLIVFELILQTAFTFYNSYFCKKISVKYNKCSHIFFLAIPLDKTSSKQL